MLLVIRDICVCYISLNFGKIPSSISFIHLITILIIIIMIFLIGLNTVDAVALGKKIAPDNDMGGNDRNNNTAGNGNQLQKNTNC